MHIEIDHTISLSLPPGWAQLILHVMLTPPNGATQSVDSWQIEVDGIEHAAQFSDAYGNHVHLVNQARPEDALRLRAHGVVTTRDTHGVLVKPAGEPVPALYKRVTSLTKAPVTVWGKFRNAKENRLDVLHALMARVGETLGLPEEEPTAAQMQATGEQSQSQGLEAAPQRPAASDYAHLFIGAARALDIPARFVCGYVSSGDGVPAGLSYWAEAYDEKLGWIGFDACYQLCPTHRYVRLVVGLDAESALPLRSVPVGELTQSCVVKAVEG